MTDRNDTLHYCFFIRFNETADAVYYIIPLYKIHQNMKEYKLAKGWAIFIYIFAPLVIALFVWLAIMPFTPASEGMSPNAAWFFIPVSLLMVGIMVYGLLDAIKGRVIIEGSKIIKKGVFGSRELLSHEIKGFIVIQYYIVIEPGMVHKKKMKISLAYGKTQEILDWLASRHPDLEEMTRLQETNEILANEQYGSTVSKRTWYWDNAKQVASYLNWAGIGVGLWAIFYPSPYLHALIACMVIPLITIVVTKLYKGLLRLDAPTGSAYPTVGGALFVPAAALAVRALQDYSVFDHSPGWLPVIIVTAVLMGASILAHKDFNLKESRHGWFVAAYLLFSMAYAYGTVIILNCYYDRSTPEVYQATVMEKKNSSSSSGDSYYFYLTPWEKAKEVEQMDVPRSVYERVNKNDVVTVLYYKGKFNIPWIRITP